MIDKLRAEAEEITNSKLDLVVCRLLDKMIHDIQVLERTTVSESYLDRVEATFTYKEAVDVYADLKIKKHRLKKNYEFLCDIYYDPDGRVVKDFHKHKLDDMLVGMSRLDRKIVRARHIKNIKKEAQVIADKAYKDAYPSLFSDTINTPS